MVLCSHEAWVLLPPLQRKMQKGREVGSCPSLPKDRVSVTHLAPLFPRCHYSGPVHGERPGRHTLPFPVTAPADVAREGWGETLGEGKLLPELQVQAWCEQEGEEEGDYSGSKQNPELGRGPQCLPSCQTVSLTPAAQSM